MRLTYPEEHFITMFSATRKTTRGMKNAGRNFGFTYRRYTTKAIRFSVLPKLRQLWKVKDLKSVMKWCAHSCVICDWSAFGSLLKNYMRTKGTNTKITLIKSLMWTTLMKYGLVMLHISSTVKTLIAFAWLLTYSHVWLWDTKLEKQTVHNL